MWLVGLALIAVCVWIAFRVVVLLRRAAVTARTAKSSQIDEWRDVNDLRTGARPWHEHWLSRLRDLAHRLKRLFGTTSTPAAVRAISLFDPVDGTIFEPGETVVRCSCGTAYHPLSWQWLGEKNGAKCVSCKQVRRATTIVLPGAAG